MKKGKRGRPVDAVASATPDQVAPHMPDTPDTAERTRAASNAVPPEPTLTLGSTPGPANPPPPTPARIRAEAELVRRLLPASYLADITGVTGFNPEGLVEYVEDGLRRAGSPKDPLSEMLHIQAMALHLRVMGAHARAAVAADDEDRSRLLSSIATELGGEFRRTVASVTAYESAIRSSATGDEGTTPGGRLNAKRSRPTFGDGYDRGNTVGRPTGDDGTGVGLGTDRPSDG